MWTLVSEIELYIKTLLRESPRGWIKLSRKELAERFDCVPSQITYVMNTRFTLRYGYCVESRRGGSGYIRICRLGAMTGQEAVGSGQRQVRPDSQPEDGLEYLRGDYQAVLYNLTQRDILTDREFTLLSAVFRALEASIPGMEGHALLLSVLKEILACGDLF